MTARNVMQSGNPASINFNGSNATQNIQNMTANPLAAAMASMALAKANPGAFANGPIKMNISSNKTGRVIS